MRPSTANKKDKHSKLTFQNIFYTKNRSPQTHICGYCVARETTFLHDVALEDFELETLDMNVKRVF